MPYIRYDDIAHDIDKMVRTYPDYQELINVLGNDFYGRLGGQTPLLYNMFKVYEEDYNSVRNLPKDKQILFFAFIVWYVEMTCFVLKNLIEISKGRGVYLHLGSSKYKVVPYRSNEIIRIQDESKITAAFSIRLKPYAEFGTKYITLFPMVSLEAKNKALEYVKTNNDLTNASIDNIGGQMYITADPNVDLSIKPIYSWVFNDYWDISIKNMEANLKRP